MDYIYKKMEDGYKFSLFYEEYIKIIKLINSYIKRLEKKGGEHYKIRNIKKYYRIIKCLEGVIRITFYKREENKFDAIVEMYKFLYEIVVKIICDIFEHIKFFQDDNYVEMQYYEDYLRFFEKDKRIYKDYNIEEWHNKFKVYSHLKHYL